MIICSLNYSPGLEKEIFLLGQLIADAEDQETEYHLHHSYDKSGRRSSFWRLLFEKEVIFYNASTLHWAIAIIRRMIGKQNLFCLHEPFKESKAGYSKKTKFIVSTKERLTQLFGFFATQFIVFSNYGEELARLHHFQRPILRLALYRDRAHFGRQKTLKVIFVGHINGTKFPDQFLAMARSGEFESFRFEIVSSSPYAVDFESDRIVVCNERPLMDSTIRDKMQEAAFVIIEHPNIVQSGVFADAIANKCLVLHTGQTGLLQYEDPEIMIDVSNSNFEELSQSMASYFEDFSAKSDNFLRLYNAEFSPEAFAQDWAQRK